MIAGIFHEGSGLGDQLFRYITVRTLAEDKRFEWGMCSPQHFKGDSFMHLDMGLSVPSSDIFTNPDWHEKDVRDPHGVDIRSYDPEINFVEDRTCIDGSFEDDKYWRHNLRNISKWLEVEPFYTIDHWQTGWPEDVCVVGFRGGEYAANSDLLLPPQYYDEAFATMRRINEYMSFEVHTDDPEMAAVFFKGDKRIKIVPNTLISHSKHTNMGLNWRALRYAKYAIIPNSAFYILPRMLKHHNANGVVTIAPRYWARRNTKVWARPACFYKEFRYV